MQSSCNVIKSNNLCSGNVIKVNTDYEVKRNVFAEENFSNDDNAVIENFKNIGEKVLKHAKDEKEKIINEAYEKAVNIEKETYEKAYKEGFNNGQEDGYKEAYEMNIEKALKEAKEIREEATLMLHLAKKEYERYLKEKTEEILDLSYNIASHIISEELTKDYGVNKFVENVLRDSKDSKSFVIRVNGVHKETLIEQLEKWRIEFSLRGEVFVLEDQSLKEGNAIVEMENGKVEVGIDKALESIKNEIF